MRRQTIEERKRLPEDIRRAEEAAARAPDSSTVSSSSVDDARNALRQATDAQRTLLGRITFLELEIADSERFIEALQTGLDSLDDADAVSTELGKIPFRFCPSCYRPLAAGDAERCPVCKEEETDRGSSTQLLRMKEEIARQIQESARTLVENRTELEHGQARLPDLEAQVERLQIQYDDLASHVTTRSEQGLRDLNRRAGYIDRQIEDLDRQISLARSLDSLTERRAQLTEEITRLRDEKSKLDSYRNRRERDSRQAIARKTADLLNGDLPREAEFETATENDVQFSFGDSAVMVSGRQNFAASSMVVLRNSFHLALLLASVEDSGFRYPRLALFDNVEDKGMEPERSYNFQRLIRDKLSGCEVEHQVIFSTSMVAAELDSPDYLVGGHYTHERKTLDIRERVDRAQ